MSFAVIVALLIRAVQGASLDTKVDARVCFNCLHFPAILGDTEFKLVRGNIITALADLYPMVNGTLPACPSLESEQSWRQLMFEQSDLFCEDTGAESTPCMIGLIEVFTNKTLTTKRVKKIKHTATVLGCPSPYLLSSTKDEYFDTDDCFVKTSTFASERIEGRIDIIHCYGRNPACDHDLDFCHEWDVNSIHSKFHLKTNDLDQLLLVRIVYVVIFAIVAAAVLTGIFYLLTMSFECCRGKVPIGVGVVETAQEPISEGSDGDSTLPQQVSSGKACTKSSSGADRSEKKNITSTPIVENFVPR